MSTQMFKAKDMKSAINLVNQEFGDDAIILSTKKNNGVVEIEASNNDEVIESHKKKLEENKNFSKMFLKEVDGSKNSKEKFNDNVKQMRVKNHVSENNLTNKNQDKIFQNIETQRSFLKTKNNNIGIWFRF